MSILVTGGLGYIGSHTCLELLQMGCDVVVLDNLEFTITYEDPAGRVHWQNGTLLRRRRAGRRDFDPCV